MLDSGLSGRYGRGVTLVEMIVAIGILGLAIGLILNLVPFSHVINRNAWDYNTAQDLANAQMEYMRATNFVDLAVPSVYQPPPQSSFRWTNNIQLPPVNSNEPNPPPVGTAFSTTVWVTPYLNYSTTFVKLVTVQVTWNQNGGAKQLVSQRILVKRIP